jgi:hypothetical protein
MPAPGSPIAVAGSPGIVALGDLNGDGKLDLVVACAKGPRIVVLLGEGEGRFRFAPGGSIPLPESPGEMALADLNGDGKLDLAIACHDSYHVTILLGDGRGGFTRAASSPVVMKNGQHPHTHGLAIGDVNGDGHPDLITVNSDDNDVSVALNNGRGGFTLAPRGPFPVGKSPYPATLADVNGDGHLDVIATSTTRKTPQEEAGSAALTLLLGDGRGDFRRSEIPLRTIVPWFVAVGDINGDRKKDLVVTHAERKELTVLLGDGKGGFAETAGSPLDIGHSAWHVALVDADGDGKLDVVAAAGDGLRVMLGDGLGNFRHAPGSPYPAGKGAWRLAVGDVNGDGKLDIVTSNVESDSVSVLLGR